MTDDNTRGARLVDALAGRPPHTTRPLNLPKYVFLMTNDEPSRKLAVSVAALMSDLDQTVYIDDFEAPIYDAFQTMFNRDFAKDYGDPQNTQALMLEAKVEASESDIIASLRDWFHKTMGADVLGRMGHKRAVDQQALTDYIYVFRDSTMDYIKPFVADKSIRPGRDSLVWPLTGVTEDAATVLAAMEKA